MTESAARWLDRHGYGDSPIHRLDARAKLAATAIFVVSVASFPKYEVTGLLPFLLLPLAITIVGRVPARPVLHLLAAASPFALLVGACNPVLDREPRALLLGVSISGGVLSFTSIVLRFVLCTGTVLLLVATTSLPALLRGLSQLGMPRPFVAQVQLLYRYLFVLVDEGRRMTQARELREPRRRLPALGTGKRMLGSLLWRTWSRGERVYLCMKVRGYDGQLPTLAPARFQAADALYVICIAAACLLARTAPFAHWAAPIALTGGSR